MSRIADLVSRGVRLIVADVPEGSRPAEAEREIPAEALDLEPPRTVERSEVPVAADFGAVYAEAGIEAPLHGYGVDKVAEMLENKRFASLGREAKATAVMVALEAAGVPVREVIEDAVKRDRALDNFEAAKDQEVQALQAQNQARIRELNQELEALIQKINAEVESLKRGSEQAASAFHELQARKRREEARLYDVVSHFVEGGAANPITTAAPAGSPPPPPRPDQA